MKKQIFYLAVAALALASCSSENDVVQDQPQAPAEQEAVSFDAYAERGVTRSGWAGSLNITQLKQTVENGGGFGVFGYYTDNNDYDQRNTPNFFYNQLVKWEGSAWTYSPIKYWPNEYGTNATSDDQDKVSYFAYAPYVDVIPTSGKLKNTENNAEQWGITGMTRNNNQGDPILKYIGSFDSKYSVDLCWGVIDNGDTNWDIVQSGTTQTTDMKAGKPWLNVYRPALTNQRVRFTFKHATAQMKVNIDADVDITNHNHANAVDKKTRVWVRQVKFTGFAMKGALNLNNENAYTPLWLDYNGQNDIVSEDMVVYDGRKDGKEGVSGAVASNEKTTGLNPTLVQDGVYANVTDGNTVYEDNDMKVIGSDNTTARAGVTSTTVNLFKDSSDTPSGLFHVIPTGDDVEIEIIYDIETVDENLSQNLSDGQTKGSSIENRITQKITFGAADAKKLIAGHSYTINLHLGLNSVKFDATVGDWIYEPTQDVDLPANTPKWTAGSTECKVTLPYTGNYTFAITGLNGGESTEAANVRTVKKNGSITIADDAEFTGWSKTENSAWSNGTAVQTVTTAPNPNTTDREQGYKWTGKQSGLVTTFRFTQAAHPLYMKIQQAGGNKRIILYRYNDASQTTTTDWGDKSGWFCDENGKELTTNGDPEATSPTNGITVYRNGTKLVWQSADDPTGNKFQFTDAGTKASSAFAATIEFGDDLKNGDVIKVVLKTGDAPIETATYQVSGL